MAASSRANSRGPVSNSFWDEVQVRERSAPGTFNIEVCRRSRAHLRRLAKVQSPARYAYTWGFIFCRTVYTPESNSIFNIALRRIHEYFRYAVFSDFQPGGGDVTGSFDPSPNRELMNRLANEASQHPVILSNATVDMIGKMFANWIGLQDNPRSYRGPHPNPRFRACVVLDKDTIDKILYLPEDPSDYDSDLHSISVKVVVPNRGRGPSVSFPVDLVDLPEFWFGMF